METFKYCSKTGTCGDIKIGLEIEVHQTNESIEQTELKLKQVELDSKHKPWAASRLKGQGK